MRKDLFFLTVFIIVFCLISIQGQIKKESALQSKFEDLFLVDKRKPSVYISFERKGKLEPLFNGESSNRIWLRINNNTRGEIRFCSFQVKKQYGDIGIVYDVNEIFGSDVEIEPDLNRDDLKIEKPNGYSTGDMCFPYYVSSGKSVLFSIPEEHLVNKNRKFDIRIQFEYEWEERRSEFGSHPLHLAIFSYGIVSTEKRN